MNAVRQTVYAGVGGTVTNPLSAHRSDMMTLMYQSDFKMQM